MDDSVPKPRYVRCPKCKNVLQEAVDVPFYRCGSCDTVLKAKYWKAGQQSSSQGEPEADGKESNSDDGGLDNLETGGNKNGNRVESRDEEIKSVVGCLNDLDLYNVDSEILCSDKTNLDVNEVELGQEQKHLASMENAGSPAHGGSNSSVDGGTGDLTMNPLQQYRQLSKRTVRSRISSGSNSPSQMEEHISAELTGSFNLSDRNEHNPENIIHTHEEHGVSGLSGESFQNSQNSIDSRCARRPFSHQTTFSANDLSSSKFTDVDEGRMNLLRKVDELRYQLIGSVVQQRSTTSFRATSRLNRCRRSQLVGIPESDVELLDHHSLARMRSRQTTYIPSASSSSEVFNSYCLHCQGLTTRENCCSSGLCMSCCRVYCPPRKVKKQAMKRHCRPIFGGSNFIICYECIRLLQIPDDFCVSRSRTNKLRCGACSEILTFSFTTNNHSESGQSEARDCFSGDFSSNTSSVFGGRNPIHAPRNSVDSGRGENDSRGQNSTALHMLMGYYSASDVIY